jgi:hypothetical protein
MRNSRRTHGFAGDGSHFCTAVKEVQGVAVLGYKVLDIIVKGEGAS